MPRDVPYAEATIRLRWQHRLVWFLCICGLTVELQAQHRNLLKKHTAFEITCSLVFAQSRKSNGQTMCMVNNAHHKMWMAETKLCSQTAPPRCDQTPRLELNMHLNCHLNHVDGATATEEHPSPIIHWRLGWPPRPCATQPPLHLFHRCVVQ